MAEKWTSIAVLIAAQVLALTLWFSATAVIPEIRAEFGLSDGVASLLSSAVALGFVAGTLASAALGISDRFDPRVVFAISALCGAALNLFLLVTVPAVAATVALRFLTGFVVAGIYPVGMRLAASWAKGDMGLLIGILVGALTIGSASPHLFNGLGGLDWHVTIVASSIGAALAAGAMFFVRIGPAHLRPAQFDPAMAFQAWRQKSLRLANLGYLGHMWELYAMWAWVGLFLRASFTASKVGPNAPALASMATFLVIGAGAIGCLAGGYLADRLGRTRVTIWAMAISGSSAATIGFLFGGDPFLLVLVAIVWGIAIVADSAQFSSCVIELADERYIGTMLTVQTSLGFLLTLATIHLLPVVVDAVSWRYAFAILAVGPFLGIWAMARLRRHPDASRIAGGRK